MDLLISGGTVITMDAEFRVIEDGIQNRVAFGPCRFDPRPSGPHPIRDFPRARSAPSLPRLVGSDLVLRVFAREARVDRLVGIGGYLQVRAMMVGVVTIGISYMGGHEFDHLQGTFRTTDIG